MTLITPKKALLPYSEEPGPRMNSTRSIRSTSRKNAVPMNPEIVIPGAQKPPDAHVMVVPVVIDVELSLGPDDVRQRPVAVPHDVPGGDDGHRGRGLRDLLIVLGGAVDRDVHELFQAYGVDRGRRRGDSPRLPPQGEQQGGEGGK